MLPITLFCASRTGREETPSLFMSSRAAAKGLSPLHVRLATVPRSTSDAYLIARTVFEPRLKSLINCGYSWFTAGKLDRFSQKNRTNLNCVSMPITLEVPSSATSTLCTPLPNTSMALDRSVVSSSVISGSFLPPTSFTSLSGMGLPSLPFFASSSNEAISPSSGCARPTTRSRYAFRSL